MLSYVLILASLLTYETPYFVFLAVPLLCLPWDRTLPKLMAKHIAFTTVIFFGVFLLRIELGDLSPANLGASAPLSNSLRHMVQGLNGVSDRTYIGRPRPFDRLIVGCS